MTRLPDDIRRAVAEADAEGAARIARQRLRNVRDECDRALAEIDGGERSDRSAGEVVRRLVEAWEQLATLRAARAVLNEMTKEKTP